MWIALAWQARRRFLLNFNLSLFMAVGYSCAPLAMSLFS